MKILIDNGHGKTTPGKRSPDGRFLEYIFNRTIARQIVADLADRGYDAELLVPEDDDIPLVERCSRANAIVSREGTDNVILVSIHTNAFGTAKNGLLPPVGASIRAKDKPEQTFSLMIWPWLP